MTDICFDVSVRTVLLCSNFDWEPAPPPIFATLFLITTSLLCNLMWGFPVKRNIKVHNMSH